MLQQASLKFSPSLCHRVTTVTPNHYNTINATRRNSCNANINTLSKQTNAHIAESSTLILIFSNTDTSTTWETFNALSLGFQWSEAPSIGLSPDSGSLTIAARSSFVFHLCTDMTGDPRPHPEGTPSCWQRGLWGNQPRRSGGGRTSVLASWKLIQSAFQKGGRFWDK